MPALARGPKGSSGRTRYPAVASLRPTAAVLLAPRARRNSGKVSSGLFSLAEVRAGRHGRASSARAFRLARGKEVRQSRRRALAGLQRRGTVSGSPACSGWRYPVDVGTGRPGGPGLEATAGAGASVQSAIVREAADVAGSSGGAPRWEHLTSLGPESEGPGSRGEEEGRGGGFAGNVGTSPVLSTVGKLQGRGAAGPLEAEGAPTLCPCVREVGSSSFLGVVGVMGDETWLLAGEHSFSTLVFLTLGE